MPSEAACRRVVLDRAEMLCERCGVGSKLTIHHRRKRSAGGPWTPENCVAVCGHGTAGCHGWIEHYPEEAAAEGFHVQPWQDEAVIPIRKWHACWTILTPGGGYEFVRRHPGPGELGVHEGDEPPVG